MVELVWWNWYGGIGMVEGTVVISIGKVGSAVIVR